MTELEEETEEEIEEGSEQAPVVDSFHAELVMPDQIEDIPEDKYVVTASELAEFGVLCLYMKEKNRSLVLTSVVKHLLWLTEHRLTFAQFLRAWKFIAELQEYEDFDDAVIMDKFFNAFETYGKFLAEVEVKRALIQRMDAMIEEREQMYQKWKESASWEMLNLEQKKANIEEYLKKYVPQKWSPVPSALQIQQIQEKLKREQTPSHQQLQKIQIARHKMKLDIRQLVKEEIQKQLELPDFKAEILKELREFIREFIHVDLTRRIMLLEDFTGIDR